MNLIPDYVEVLGKFWLLKNDNSICAESKRYGTIAYDKTFAELPELKAMPRGSQAVDVGAFIGDTARIFLNSWLDVIAFEPQPDAFECLKHNCPLATCHRIAMGDGRMVKLYQSDGGNMGGRPVVPGEGFVTQRLDDWLPEDLMPTFLKVDAEGFEPAILDGAPRVLADPNLLHVACEINPQAMARFGWVENDVFKHFVGWKRREIFRYGDENWDVLFSR